MADLYTDAEIDMVTGLIKAVHPTNTDAYKARVILDAVAPRIGAKVLRDAANEHSELILDSAQQAIRVVLAEDLLDLAAEIERGFGK